MPLMQKLACNKVNACGVRGAWEFLTSMPYKNTKQAVIHAGALRRMSIKQPHKQQPHPTLQVQMASAAVPSSRATKPPACNAPCTSERSWSSRNRAAGILQRYQSARNTLRSSNKHVRKQGSPTAFLSSRTREGDTPMIQDDPGCTTNATLQPRVRSSQPQRTTNLRPARPPHLGLRTHDHCWHRNCALDSIVRYLGGSRDLGVIAGHWTTVGARGTAIFGRTPRQQAQAHGER
jgi:hypothetical protein